MPQQRRDVAPGPAPRSVRCADGALLTVPAHWVLVPPGDPGLTRRVKAAGPAWTVKEARGRRVFSQGIWADGATVERIRAELAVERADPAHVRKLEAARKRRELAQARYADEFAAAVLAFLDFAPSHALLGRVLATAITEGTIDVGSGTVARTERIPIERRAEAAAIAWLRHQTTAYDDMDIPRIKGMRRQVRRMLAERSRTLLERYRRGEHVEPALCPLRRALGPFTD